MTARTESLEQRESTSEKRLTVMEQRAFKLNRAVAIGSLIMVGIGCAAIFIEVGSAKSEMRETKSVVSEMRTEFKSLRMDVTELKTLRQDVAELRSIGSPGFRAHEKQDDERVAEMRMQLADIKDTLKRVTQVQLDFADLRATQAVLQNKIDAIKEAIDIHMRQIPGGMK